MYTTLIAWLKTYTDLYLTSYYDDYGQPRWFLRDIVNVTITGNDDEDVIPSGMAKSVYPFTLQFHTGKINNSTDLLTTAFESLLSDLTQLYIFNNPITYESNNFKITNISHRPYEDESLFGYELQIDLTHWEYLT